MQKCMPYVLKQQAINRPDHSAIEFRTHKKTYADVYREATALAGYLQQFDYEKNTVIGIFMDNHADFPVIYFGIQLAGLIAMPINTKLAPTEVAYIIEHSEAKAMFCDTALIEKMAATGMPLAQCFTTEELPTIYAHEPYEASDVDDEDIAVIMYTSGTTGKPKGVMLSYRAIYEASVQWETSSELTAQDRVFICTPLFHCAGLHVFLTPTIMAGGSFIIEEAFSPTQAPTWLRDSQATIFFGVPAMYMLLLNNDDFSTFDLSKLRLFAYGAAPMPYELIAKLRQLFPHVALQNFYGQTENSPCSTTLKGDDVLEKIGSVGKPPTDKTSVRIATPDGEELPNGVVGEIAVKGPQTMTGYLRNPEETAHALRDGWLFTGDLGRLDDDGFLYIVDRQKDMLIRGGENVYPVEVEEVLFQMPEVLEAAVVGIPHPVYGEVPKAYVCLKAGQSLTIESLMSYCSERLAKYKIPMEMEVLEALPRNASGKVLKHVLRSDR